MEARDAHSKVISGHYKTWAERNAHSWVLSGDYFAYWATQVIDLLELTSSDRICDLGSGNGFLSAQIAKRVKPTSPLICVEPSHPTNTGETDAQIVHEAAKAEDYLSLCRPDSFDKILIKQAIHHLTKLPQPELAALMFKILSRSGKVLILTMPPTIQYPTFAALRSEFEKYQVDFSGLETSFAKAGFSVTKGFRDYPVHIGKESYFEAIRARYISDLANFTEAEIENGILEIRERYGDPDRYEFADRLWFFLMTKPAGAVA